MRLSGLFYVSVHMNLCNSIGLELPLGLQRVIVLL